MLKTRKCSFIDCNNKHYAKDLCKKHYDNEYKKQWIKDNPDKRKNHVNKWKNNNPEKIKLWYKNNSEKVKAEPKKWTKENLKKHKESVKKWNKKHPECFLESNLKYLEKLGKLFNMNSKEYYYALVSWSKTIKKLDNNMCKLCDSKKELNAHHIMPKVIFPELSFIIDNGITLCKKCHSKTHGFEIY